MGNIIVPVDERLYSTLQIGTEEFPFGLFHDDLDNFQKGFVNWHNQTTIEISFVLEGSLKVCLLKEEHIVSAGEAFVVLANHMHSIQPVEKERSYYYTLIWEERLFTGYPGSFFDSRYYEPVATSSPGFYHIPPTPELQPFFSNMHWIFHNYSESDPDNWLQIQRRLQDIWITLYRNVFQVDTGGKADPENARILLMLNYLRQNYSEKFSLDRMSSSLHVSRGECCRFFKKMMGMTITEYLLEYRLGKATELLKHSSKSITEIAHDVGFNSVSNFSALFREKTGQTPGQYRKR